MIHVIVTKGIPASGKSTWAKELIRDNPGQYKRINKDDLRAMLDCSKWSQENEKFVVNARDYLINQALRDGVENIIIDDTNLDSKHEKRIRQIAQRYVNSTGNCVIFEIKYFPVELGEAIYRDSLREGTAKVGERVIRTMFDKWCNIKNKKDSYEELYPVYGNVQHDNTLEKVVISDIDGTLARMVDRGPFEWKRVGEDEPIETTIDLVNRLHDSGRKIIFFSGRDEVCRTETTNWLKEYFNFDIELYMRKENDFRKDNIVKYELYEKYILGKYSVDFILDDRDQVVDMFRMELGLTVLQVNYGCF